MRLGLLDILGMVQGGKLPYELRGVKVPRLHAGLRPRGLYVGVYKYGVM